MRTMSDGTSRVFRGFFLNTEHHGESQTFASQDLAMPSGKLPLSNRLAYVIQKGTTYIQCAQILSPAKNLDRERRTYGCQNSDVHNFAGTLPKVFNCLELINLARDRL